MSTFAQKADISGRNSNVRFAPEADIQEFSSYQKKTFGLLYKLFALRGKFVVQSRADDATFEIKRRTSRVEAKWIC